MAVELITGHQATNHITADDGRTTNRAIFGKKPCRLAGEYNSTVYDGTAVNSKVGLMTATQFTGPKYRGEVDVGLIYWNGMFIRITSKVYQSPQVSSEEGVRVYLHYTRSEAGVESVEVLFTTAEYTSSDVFDFDNTSEAYLLYGTFDNAAGTNKTYYLPIVNDMMGRKKAINQFAVGNDVVKLGEVTLVNASTYNDSGTQTFALSETPENFEFIELRLGINNTQGRVIMRVPSHYFKYHNNGMVDGLDRVEWQRHILNKIRSWQFAFYYNAAGDVATAGKMTRFENGEFSAETTSYYLRVYGVGRIV